MEVLGTLLVLVSHNLWGWLNKNHTITQSTTNLISYDYVIHFGLWAPLSDQRWARGCVICQRCKLALVKFTNQVGLHSWVNLIRHSWANPGHGNRLILPGKFHCTKALKPNLPHTLKATCCTVSPRYRYTAFAGSRNDLAVGAAAPTRLRPLQIQSDNGKIYCRKCVERLFPLLFHSFCCQKHWEWLICVIGIFLARHHILPLFGLPPSSLVSRHRVK